MAKQMNSAAHAAFQPFPIGARVTVGGKSGTIVAHLKPLPRDREFSALVKFDDDTTRATGTVVRLSAIVVC